MFRLSVISSLAFLLLAACGCQAEAPACPKKAKSRVVLAFTASWCGPCRKNEPKLQELERQGINVRRVDVDREPELARRYGIRSVPTYVVVEDGREVDRTQNIAILIRILKAIRWLLFG